MGLALGPIPSAGASAVAINDGDVGSDSSMVLDGAGSPVVAYIDATNDDLKILRCGNAQCSSGNTVATPDSDGFVGGGPSMALDRRGHPVVSYIDYATFDLKILRCGNTTCSARNTIRSIAIEGTVGGMTSLALDSGDRPVVAFADYSSTRISVLRCATAACDGSISLVAAATPRGSDEPSLALKGNDHPVISFHSSSNFSLNLLHCGDVSCSEGNRVVRPDSKSLVGADSSMALDSRGFPVVAYLDNWNDELLVLRCSTAICDGDNSIATVDANGVAGAQTSIVLDEQNKPIVSYRMAATEDLKILRCGNSTCSSQNVIAVADSAGVVGAASSAAYTPTGGLAVSYYDTTNGDLKIYRALASSTGGAILNLAEPTAVDLRPAPTATPRPTARPGPAPTATPRPTARPAPTATLRPTPEVISASVPAGSLTQARLDAARDRWEANRPNGYTMTYTWSQCCFTAPSTVAERRSPAAIARHWHGTSRVGSQAAMRAPMTVDEIFAQLQSQMSTTQVALQATFDRSLGYPVSIRGDGYSVAVTSFVSDYLVCLGRPASIIGGPTASSIVGTEFDDVILGGAGNDTIDARGGNDVVCAGGGADDITGGPGEDQVHGEGGDDLIRGAAARDVLNGGPGDDTMYGDSGNDLLQGGDGSDTIYGGVGGDTMYGDSGNDVLLAGPGFDKAWGGLGDDNVQGAGGDDFLDGGPGADSLYGKPGDDEIRGGDGDDEIYAASGDDLVFGGAGADRIQGAGGADELFGDGGADVLWGQDGDDLLAGGDDNDSLYGGGGTDRLWGQGGRDTLHGGGGTDTCLPGSTTEPASVLCST